jgi:hypothetical protein
LAQDQEFSAARGATTLSVVKAADKRMTSGWQAADISASYNQRVELAIKLLMHLRF